MRAQVIFASLLMLIVPLAGCITDSAVVPDDPAPPVRAVDHNTTRSNMG